MDNPNPTNQIAPADRSRMREMLSELTSALSQDPMTVQRDHYARMWDEVMENVLKNLQQIRDDNTAIRRRLDDGARAGAQETQAILNGTERILKAIQNAKEEIIASVIAQTRKKSSWWK